LSLPDPNPRPLDHLTSLGRLSDPALKSRDLVLDYAGFDAAVGRLAGALLASGLQKGDRVASWMNKTVEACLMPLASARAGLVHVPVNPALKHAQVAHILADSGCRLLITGKGRADGMAAGDRPEGCALLLEEDARAAWGSGEILPLSSHDPAELAAILYTSGSTGKPKGVMLSHSNLWLGAVSVAHYLKLAADDRTLCVLPLSFDYGQNQLLSTWAAGGCVVPFDYLMPKDVVRAVEREAITTLAGVPPLWVQLVEANWPDGASSTIRRVTNSGGALSKELVARMTKTFSMADVYPMYGLTESFRSTYLDPALVPTHPTSMGKAIPFAEILIVRSDGSITDDGEAGELVHCGPLVAQGYWQDAERTGQRFKPAPPASRFGGMAVWSGDKVRREVDGLLYFIGRDDEMIKSSGNRISPAEIEDAAQASGAVLESAAFGIADERLGQAIILVATPTGADADARLKSWFKAELPLFMQPKSIIWQQDLPRNPNGKLDRVALKQAVQAGELKS
jgi:acyl-CoA ligase (AMP-forming) (exosortase A-associated)